MDLLVRDYTCRSNIVIDNDVLNIFCNIFILINIGRLEVRIPWSNLGVDPVAIIIDKVHFLLEPTYEWKPGAAEKRLQAIKQAKLSAAELFASKRVEEDSTNTSSWNYGQYLKQWFLSSFLTRVIEHIQITVREVHIRYEDHLSCPTSFAIGIHYFANYFICMNCVTVCVQCIYM